MRVRSCLTIAALVLNACGMVGIGDPRGEHGDRLASYIATQMDFSFDGKLIADAGIEPAAAIEQQLMYTVGQLNGEQSVGRMADLVLSNVQAIPRTDGALDVSYHAELPVGWASKTNLPTSYRLYLPLDMRTEGQSAFFEKYHEHCVESGGHPDLSSMWYYYRPTEGGCSLSEADAVVVDATTTVSPLNTQGKFPEYDKVWEDGALTVVAVFAKDEEGSASNSDAGTAGYNRFLKMARESLLAGGGNVQTTPPEFPANPGTKVPYVVFEATRADERKLRIDVMLVDGVRGQDALFEEHYSALSGTADVLIYGGHSGLGRNIRAIASKSEFVAGKYQLFFMNGCDTFAYIDKSIWERKASANSGDAAGSKYLDMIVNLMPSGFETTPYSEMAVIDALIAKDTPQNYENILQKIDRSQVVVVVGEEDNVFAPVPGGELWSGERVTDRVGPGGEATFKTATLSRGKHKFALEPDAANPGGDADLYVAIGRPPTDTDFDCRPYLEGSEEQCEINLLADADIYVRVLGFGDGYTHFAVSAELGP